MADDQQPNIRAEASPAPTSDQSGITWDEISYGQVAMVFAGVPVGYVSYQENCWQCTLFGKLVGARSTEEEARLLLIEKYNDEIAKAREAEIPLRKSPGPNPPLPPADSHRPSGACVHPMWSEPRDNLATGYLIQHCEFCRFIRLIERLHPDHLAIERTRDLYRHCLKQAALDKS